MNLKQRYALYGKYKLNLEEIHLLKEFEEREGMSVIFNVQTETDYAIFDLKKRKIGLVSTRVFVNIPQDREYTIKELLVGVKLPAKRKERINGTKKS